MDASRSPWLCLNCGAQATIWLKVSDYGRFKCFTGHCDRCVPAGVELGPGCTVQPVGREEVASYTVHEVLSS